jgi:hypothetical protein
LELGKRFAVVRAGINSMCTPAKRNMDKQLQVFQLCLPLLAPEDVCMMRCSCIELRDMRVSWQDHSIRFKLDGSPSAILWLYRNIVSIQDLYLQISVDLPTNLLLGLLGAGK